jgi:hypothetical protein
MVRRGLVGGCDSEEYRFAERHRKEVNADGQPRGDWTGQARSAWGSFIADAIEYVRREARGNSDRWKTERAK